MALSANATDPLDEDPEEFRIFYRGVQDVVEDARVAVYRRLFLDRWEDWTLPAAIDLAAGLGADRNRVHELLDAEVRRHIAELQDDLSA